MKRRLFLKSAMATGVVATAVSAGLLTSGAVFADTEAFKSLSGKQSNKASSASSGNFKFKAPKIAENGAVVPIKVDATNMSGVTNISLLTEKNTTPLSGSYNFSNGALGFVAVRVKMAKTSPVTALVTANGEVSKVSQEIKVTIGGCGG